MIGNRTHFPENDDLPLWRGAAVKINTYKKRNSIKSFWKVFSRLVIVE